MIVFHCLSNLPIEQSLYRGIHARFWMQVMALLNFPPISLSNSPR
jgi:hypothetical protein